MSVINEDMRKKLLTDEEKRTSYLWHKIRSCNALSRGLLWELDKPFIQKITKESCFYCGREPSNVLTAKIWNLRIIYQGIDRLDNSLGYTLTNCVPCCLLCNRTKSYSSVDSFLNWIKNIYERRIATECKK